MTVHPIRLSRSVAGLQLRRVLSVASAVSLILVFMLASGCAKSDAPASGMGMGGGSGGGSGARTESTGFVMGAGLIAAADTARIELGTRATWGTSKDGIHIARVLAPVDGWLVVRSATAPGAVLGKVSVKRGENTDVTIPLDQLDSPKVRIALHADRGTRGTFEFDPMAKRTGADNPIFAGRARVERQLTLARFGAQVVFGTALIRAESQQVMGNAVSVSYTLMPGPSWITVNRVKANGLLGERLGLIGRPAGEAMLVMVPLSGKVAKGERLAVTAFADRGVQDVFEFADTSATDSPDQPYVSGDALVTQWITAR